MCSSNRNMKQQLNAENDVLGKCFSGSLDFRCFKVLILFTCWFMFTLFPFILWSFKYSTWHLVLHIAHHSMHPQCATNTQTSKQKWELTVVSVRSICLIITRHFNVKKNEINKKLSRRAPNLCISFGVYKMQLKFIENRYSWQLMRLEWKDENAIAM